MSRRYGLHGRGTGVQFTVKAEKFVLSTAPRMLEMDAMGSLPGVKAVGHEADHSLLSKAEVKNAWSYTSSPRYTFVLWCFIYKQERPLHVAPNCSVNKCLMFLDV